MLAAIIQARVGSTRLPRKVFADIQGKPLIWHVVERLKRSKYLDKIIIATTTSTSDSEIVNWAKNNGIDCFRGSEKNVLERYFRTAEHFTVDTIVRITADDPFKDYQVMDKVIEKYKSMGVDLACNNYPPTYPEGLDIEVFSMNALQQAYLKVTSDYHREHVTQYFYEMNNSISIFNLSHKRNLSYLRWTIDENKDLEMARLVYQKLYKNGKIFLMNDIVDLIHKHPEIAAVNHQVVRSHMYKG